MSRMKWPTVTEVSVRLNEVRRRLLRTYFTETIDKWLTIKLEVCEDQRWRLHIGDAVDRDDHSSFWGTDDISLKCNCLEIASNMIREARDHAYIHGVK